MDFLPVGWFHRVRLLGAFWRVRGDWMSQESQLSTVRKDEFGA